MAGLRVTTEVPPDPPDTAVTVPSSPAGVVAEIGATSTRPTGGTGTPAASVTVWVPAGSPAPAVMSLPVSVTVVGLAVMSLTTRPPDNQYPAAARMTVAG